MSMLGLSVVMLESTSIYIINHSDIFGIQRIRQTEEKVSVTHFLEIISWFLTVLEAGLATF